MPTPSSAQTSRQGGLSSVYTELLSYEGNEVYLTERPKLAGRTLDEVLFVFEAATAIGIASPGQPPRLNPPAATTFAPGDRLIVTADEIGGLQPASDRPVVDGAAIDMRQVARSWPS